MKALEFKGQNVIIAKDQPQYLNLPAFIENGISTFLFELEESEIKNGSITIGTNTFGHPPQAVRISVEKPNFKTLRKRKFNASPSWDGELSIFSKKFYKTELKTLNRTKKIWVSIITFNKPLHPIRIIK